jgi:PKD repeat protein
VTLTNQSRSGHTASFSATLTVLAAALTGSGQPVTATESATFVVTVASFTTADPFLGTTTFSASIDWGDGTAATAGSIVANGGGGNFLVRGSHKYAEAGSYPVSVSITGNDGASLAVQGTATIADAALSGFGGFVSGTHGVALPVTTQVGTLHDANASAPASEFTATIDWGDGSTSLGSVTGSGGSYAVKGGHTYAAAGSYPVKVTVVDQDGATVTLTGSASIN